ncbi:MAG: hypothetical protein HYV17_07445 [Xanthomonadales bacterium]|nr:hypothetical protein [Xanthomonadales bacterium]
MNFNDAEFDITSLTTVGAGALCSLFNEDGAGQVNITYNQAAASAIPAGTYDVCTFVIDHVGAAPGSFPYTFTLLNAEDDTANPVAISGTDGNVVVSAGPAVGPTITYTPAPAGTVTFPAASSVGGSTTAPITLAMAGGSNGGTTVLSACSGSIGNVTFTDGADTCTAGGACVDGDLTLQCVSTNATQTGTATCTETRLNETVAGDGITVVTARTWNFTCPAGNQAPTLTAAPNFDADATSDATPEVTLPVVGIGMTASGNVAITAAGQSGTGSATMSACAGAGGISVAPALLTFSANGSQNLAFSCTAGAAPSSGTVTCTETDFDSAGVTRLWDVLCPAGTPESAPGVTYAPAAASTLTFAQGASIGAVTTQNVTVDINGGVDGGDATPESMSVTCSTASAGYTVTGGGPYSANSAAAAGVDGTVTVSCAAAAAQQLGTLTCTETPSIDAVPQAPTPRTWNLDCPAAAVNITANPAEGAITLVGPPNTNVNGTINLTNTGSASTLACTATGAVTLGAVPASVPAGGAAAVPYTCLTGAAGVAGTGTIQCTTQDAAPDDVLDYTVSCMGLSSVPVPAISNFGKVLLASLVIGLGLLGLGARRQMI